MNSLSYFNGNSVSLSNTNLLLLCICNLSWLWGLNSAVYSSSTQHCSLLLLMAFPISVINIFQSISLILCFVKILLCNASIQLTLFLFLTSLIILKFIYHLHISPLHSFAAMPTKIWKQPDCKWAENIALHAKLYILFVSLCSFNWWQSSASPQIQALWGRTISSFYKLTVPSRVTPTELAV